MAGYAAAVWPLSSAAAASAAAARFGIASRPSGPWTRAALGTALFYWPVCQRALVVALVVGTILMLINQADVLLSGHASALTVAKIGLTYLVPFSVSTYSALAANRLR